jgi:hypothetical protein
VTEPESETVPYPGGGALLYVERVRTHIGGFATALVVFGIISLMAAGVYACCPAGAVSARYRQS